MAMDAVMCLRNVNFVICLIHIASVWIDCRHEGTTHVDISSITLPDEGI